VKLDKKIIAAIVLVPLVVFFYYVAYYVQAREGEVFLGWPASAPDLMQYVAFADEAATAPVFQNPHDTYDANAYAPCYIMLPLTVVGLVAKVAGISPFLSYVICTYLAGCVLVFSIYWFSLAAFRNPEKGRMFFWIALFSSGLGWLVTAARVVRHGDASIFLNPLQFSRGASSFVMDLGPTNTIGELANILHVAGLALIFLGFAFFIRYLRNERMKDLLAASGIFFLIPFCHAYSGIVPPVVLASFYLLVLAAKLLTPLDVKLRISLKNALIFAVPVVLSAVGTLYFKLVATQINQGFADLAMKFQYYLVNIILPMVVIGFGIPFLCAVLYLACGFLRKNGDVTPTRLLMLAWFLSMLFMMQNGKRAPYHFAVYLYPPCAYFCAAFIRDVLYERAKRWRAAVSLNAVFAVVFIPTLLSQPIRLAGDVYIPDEQTRAEVYLTADEYGAFEWINTNEKRKIILMTETRGTILPALTDCRPYLGWCSSRHREKRKALAEFFAGGTTDAARTAFLKDNKIAYLFYGPHEQRRMRFDPREKHYLTHVQTFRNSLGKKTATSIFKVTIEE